METSEVANEFESVKQRLEEIAQAVADENMPLDEALDLYEEAVALGLKASDLLEVGVVVDDPAENSDALRASNDGRLTAAGELELAPTAQPGTSSRAQVGPTTQPGTPSRLETASQVEPVGASSSSPGSPQASGDNSTTGMTSQPSTSSNQDPSTD